MKTDLNGRNENMEGKGRILKAEKTRREKKNECKKNDDYNRFAGYVEM